MTARRSLPLGLTSGALLLVSLASPAGAEPVSVTPAKPKAIFAPAAPAPVVLGAGVSSGGPTAGPASSDASPNPLAKAAGEKKSISLGDDTGKGSKSGVLVPETHTVHKGDTLWDICDHYYGNPWQWPRVWSYNPDILNPHWIYPGEVVRLKKNGVGFTPSAVNTVGKGGVVLKPKTVPGGTVFLRNYGYIYDKDHENTGEIMGSPEEKMLLSTYDPVYVKVTKDQAEKLYPGDTLTVFVDTRPVKKGDQEFGRVVQILGTVKVDSIDKKTNFVEGTIVESLDVIERGARVGPVDRRIDVVPPKTNDVDLRGTIVSSLQPNVIYGAQQIVLVDKGEDDGLKMGNRLFVVRKGDAFRKGLSSTGALTASKVEIAEKEATVKEDKGVEDAPEYPEEVIAEVRVVRLRKKTTTCLVTSSKKEIEPGDVWVTKKGY